MNAITTIQEAIEFLGAEERDGNYVYLADETSTYYEVSESDLEALVELSQDGNEDIARDAYSHWCAGYGSEMTGRYEVCVGSENSNGIGRTIFATDDAGEAKRVAERHAMDYSFGTIIHDTEMDMVDAGDGWEPTEVSDEDIAALRNEAHEAGDYKMAGYCTDALDNDDQDARNKCALAIGAARLVENEEA